MQRQDSEPRNLEYFVGQTQEEQASFSSYYETNSSEHMIQSPRRSSGLDQASSDSSDEEGNININSSNIPNPLMNPDENNNNYDNTQINREDTSYNIINNNTTNSTSSVASTSSLSSTNSNASNSNNNSSRNTTSRSQRFQALMVRIFSECGSCFGTFFKHMTLLICLVILLGNLWLTSAGVALIVSIGRCSSRYDCPSRSTSMDDEGPSTRTLHWGSGFLGICPWVGIILVAISFLFWWSMWPLVSRWLPGPHNQAVTWRDVLKYTFFVGLSVLIALSLTVGMYYPSQILGDLITNGRCYSLQSCKSNVEDLEPRPDRWTSQEGYSRGWGCTALGGSLLIIPLGFLTMCIENLRRTGNQNRARNDAKPAPEHAAA